MHKFVVNFFVFAVLFNGNDLRIKTDRLFLDDAERIIGILLKLLSPLPKFVLDNHFLWQVGNLVILGQFEMVLRSVTAISSDVEWIFPFLERWQIRRSLGEIENQFGKMVDHHVALNDAMIRRAIRPGDFTRGGEVF